MLVVLAPTNFIEPRELAGRLGTLTAYPRVAVPAETVLTMIVPFWPMVMTVPVVVPGVDAVSVNAPATLPARSVTRATPLESVSADPDAGMKPPVLSEVVKMTATLGAGLPLVSLTSACTIPGLVGEIVLVAFPDKSVSVSVMLDWPVGVVGVDAQPGSSGLRLGAFTQVLSLPPPQPDRT